MKVPEQFRVSIGAFQSSDGDPFGCFQIPPRAANGRGLCIIAADGEETGWDHVSVSILGSLKCPSWDEMRIVKDLFFEDTDCVVQFHPAKADYVNVHPGVLHLWRHIEGFPMPPKICV